MSNGATIPVKITAVTVLLGIGRTPGVQVNGAALFVITLGLAGSGCLRSGLFREGKAGSGFGAPRLSSGFLQRGFLGFAPEAFIAKTSQTGRAA